jgi:hypothetical protein
MNKGEDECVAVLGRASKGSLFFAFRRTNVVQWGIMQLVKYSDP